MTLADIRNVSRVILDSNILLYPPLDFILALQLQRRCGLLTNDSLHLAVAERVGINEIATADKGFDSVQSLIVYKPADITTP